MLATFEEHDTTFKELFDPNSKATVLFIDKADILTDTSDPLLNDEWLDENDLHACNEPRQQNQVLPTPPPIILNDTSFDPPEGDDASEGDNVPEGVAHDHQPCYNLCPHQRRGHYQQGTALDRKHGYDNDFVTGLTDKQALPDFSAMMASTVNDWCTSIYFQYWI